MNKFRGQVTFRLSPEGVTALEGVLDKPSFTGIVESVDELGAWVFVGEGRSLMLLKWDYFATAVVAFTPQDAPSQKVDIGFRP